jgi:hypothetical protein
MTREEVQAEFERRIDLTRTKYTTEPCGGGGEWYFVTDGNWIEGGDMSESTALAIAERLNEQAAEIKRLKEAIRVRGGCRMLSDGDKCDCGLCVRDNEIERLANRVAELTDHLDWLRWSEEGVAEAKKELERLRTERDALADWQRRVVDTMHENAGNLQNPYAYIMQSRWDELKKEVEETRRPSDQRLDMINPDYRKFMYQLVDLILKEMKKVREG